MTDQEDHHPGGRSATGRPWVYPLLIVALALISYVWVLWLPFQLDDFTHIRLAPEQVEAVCSRILSGGRENGPVPEGGYFFRPTMWLMNACERNLSGDTASPALFHTTSWLLHGVVSLLVWWLLRGFLGRGAATLGASVFAVHPAGAQAVSWISARGDQLLTLFAVLAALAVARLWRRGGLWMAAACGLGVAGALLSKMPALVLVPLALLAVGAAPGRPTQRLARVGICLVMILFGIAARWAYLGTLVPTYAAGSSFSLEALPRMVERAPSMALQMLVPWNYATEALPLRPALAGLLGIDRAAAGGGAPALQLVPAFLLLLGPLAALCFAPLRHGRRLLVALGVLVVCALPPLFLWTPAAYTGLSRTHYLLMVPVAAIWGSAAASLMGVSRPARRWRRGLLLAWLVVHAIVSVDALVHVARIEREAGKGVRARLQGIYEVAGRASSDCCFIAVDPKADFAGMPVLAELIEKAVQPPFTTRPLRVKHVRSRKDIIFLELLTTLAGPVQVVEFRDGRFRETGPLLPAIPATLPELTPAEPADGFAWRPGSSLPVRAVAGLRIGFAPGDAQEVVLEVTGDGRAFERVLHVPAGAERREIVVGLDDELEFLLTARLELLRILPSAAGAAPPSVLGTPELLSSIPRIVLMEPREEASAAWSSEFDFRLKAVPHGSSVRLSLYFWLPPYYRFLKCTFRPDQLGHFAEGIVSCRPHPGVHQETDHQGLAWSRVPSHLQLLLEDFGISQVLVRWRAEALDSGGRNVIARSPWSLFILSR